MEETKTVSYRVCVTGGNGLIASYLIKKLMLRGHTAHATLRSLDDESKVGMLKGLPGAETRLVLFEAGTNRLDGFEEAIRGCDFVFHVATVFLRPGSKCEDVVDGVLTLLRTITKHCVESGTVKRLIYTGSVVSTSPMKEDGSGYKDFIDESCFTPFGLPVRYSSESLQSYTDSKTVASKELLRYDTDQQNGECKGLEVVNLECGLTAGDTILPYVSSSLPLLLSTVTNNEIALQSLLYLDELCGRVPIVHMDDVCEAHIFCMEQQSMRGRFLCASSYVSSAEIAQYYAEAYPELGDQKKLCLQDGPKRDIKWGSTKLPERGFKYKHDSWQTIVDDTVACAKRLGSIN